MTNLDAFLQLLGFFVLSVVFGAVTVRFVSMGYEMTEHKPKETRDDEPTK